jgi:hypothetical protein
MDSKMVGLPNVPGSPATAASKSLPKQALHAVPTLIVGGAVVFSLATIAMVAFNAYHDYAAQQQSAIGPVQMDNSGGATLAGRVVSVCTLDSTPTPFTLPLADCIDQVVQAAQALSGTELPRTVASSIVERIRTGAARYLQTTTLRYMAGWLGSSRPTALSIR